ncbi:MAG: hypothetical protein ISQ09_11975, partial [Rubripirellula sp.]|nr:hypothetical protein [Rubripirellula sp.]
MRNQVFVLVAILLPVFAECQRQDVSSDVLNLPTQKVSSQTHVEDEQKADADVELAADRQISSDESALAVFESRILPIFQAKKPSSCTECHLSGVELSDYIGPNQEQTFASLVSVGLINVQNPDASKILEFIKRQPEKPTLVSSQVRQEELNAFQAWIRAAVADPKLISSRSDRAIGPQVPEEVIVHARKDRVLQSFLDNIWTEVGRCAACHSPDQNAKQVKEHGESVSWITLNDPQATLDYMLDAGIINAEHPLESLLITKPTLQVEHGGGKKLVVGDRSYKQFRGFINDYSSVVKGAYRTVDSLPIESDEVSLVTDIWFKLTEVPAEYDKMLLQVDIYRWEGDSWSEYRVASSDRQVFGGGNLWQHSLSLTAPRQS